MNDISQMETVFADVRKAYRLLYTYQSRVLDIIRFVSHLTSRTYNGGWNKFGNSSPKDGKGNLNQSAWDWLSMCCYEFHFDDEAVNNDPTGFSIWLVSDTGFYDGESTDKSDLNSYTSIEDATTKLVFVAGKNIWLNDFPDFEDNLKARAPEYIKKNEKGILLAKSFNLSAFISADETRKQLQKFNSFCHANGITGITLLN